MILYKPPAKIYKAIIFLDTYKVNACSRIYFIFEHKLLAIYDGYLAIYTGDVVTKQVYYRYDYSQIKLRLLQNSFSVLNYYRPYWNNDVARYKRHR